MEKTMGVGWIEHFYINADKPLRMKCVDDQHLGSVSQINGGEHFAFDNKDWHTFDSNTQWSASWCGIPWYSTAPPLGHYREIAVDNATVMFYQSQVGGANYLWYQNVQTGRHVARLAVG